MKKFVFSLGALALSFIFGGQALHAQIDLIAGEIVPITGPNDIEALKLPENIVYAVNVWGEQDRVIKGVNFWSDLDPNRPELDGYRTDFTHNVTNWQAKPDFGDSADDDEFEELMSDIRWTDNSAGDAVGVHFEVAMNTEYALELLISGNHAENRIWDIYIDDELVVDEFQSNNYEDYDQGVVWAYRHTLIAKDNELNVTFNQGTTGSDGNAILQGVILSIAGEGVTPGDFNDDGNIDTADFNILLSNFHKQGVSFGDGDINFDRTVDLFDFVEFRKVFESANAAGAAVVPEPGTLLSLVYGGALLLALGRYRRRRMS